MQYALQNLGGYGGSVENGACRAVRRSRDKIAAGARCPNSDASGSWPETAAAAACRVGRENKNGCKEAVRRLLLGYTASPVAPPFGTHALRGWGEARIGKTRVMESVSRAACLGQCHALQRGVRSGWAASLAVPSNQTQAGFSSLALPASVSDL